MLIYIDAVQDLNNQLINHAHTYIGFGGIAFLSK